MIRIRTINCLLLVSGLLLLAACGGDDGPTDPGVGGGGGGPWDPPTADAARATGSLTVARNQHTATLLPDGRVLITGGFDGSAKLASCEIYDPEAETWSLTASLSVARVLHTATLLEDGRVLVVGGSNPNSRSLKTFEIYDPATGTWTEVEPYTPPDDQGSELLYPRYAHAATVLTDGNVLVTGGFDSFLTSGLGGDYEKTCELFRPAFGEFDWPEPSNVCRMQDRRYCHSSTLLLDGRVLLAGGFNNEGNYLTAVEIYDAAQDTCIAAAPMATPRMWHGTFLLDDGRVLVAGGKNAMNGFMNTCEIYDPAADSWSAAPGMRDLRNRPAFAYLHDGRLVAAGNIFTHSSEICIPGGTWTLHHDLLAQRHLFTMTVFANDVVLVVGGQDATLGGNEGFLASCELYVP